MKKVNQKEVKMNSYLEVIKKGKYDNMYLTIYLENGEEIKLQVKQAFYNSKLAFKIKKALEVK